MSKLGDMLKKWLSNDYLLEQYDRGSTSFNKDKAELLDSIRPAVNAVAPVFQSAVSKYTGAGLTAAEQEANAFNASEAQKQRDWETQMSNTAIQRSVQDAQAAGVNPALMFGNLGSASTPSGSSASSVSPGSGFDLISAAISAFMAPAQKRAVEAQANASNAEAVAAKASAKKTEVDTVGSELENEFKRATMEDRKESERLKNSVSKKQLEKADHEIKQIDEHIELMKKQEKSEETKQALERAQKILADANARQIVEMLPYMKRLSAAKESASKSAAALSLMQAFYQKRIISSDYLDNMFAQMEAAARKTSSEADAAKATADILAIKASIRNGTYGLVSDDGSFGAKVQNFFNGPGAYLLHSLYLNTPASGFTLSLRTASD